VHSNAVVAGEMARSCPGRYKTCKYCEIDDPDSLPLFKEFSSLNNIILHLKQAACVTPESAACVTPESVA